VKSYVLSFFWLHTLLIEVKNARGKGPGSITIYCCVGKYRCVIDRSQWFTMIQVYDALCLVVEPSEQIREYHDAENCKYSTLILPIKCLS